MSLMSGVANFYETSDGVNKKNFLDSIFMNKLHFDGKKYRTTKSNELITLLFSNEEGFGSVSKKKATFSSGLSIKAPPLGLEPRTL